MTNAAFFLITRNLKNRVVRSVRRLRQPRYIAGVAVAALYFWSVFFRRRMIVDVRLQYGAPNEIMILFVTIVALVLLLSVWAIPSDEVGLVFTEAEIQFFFPGPVTRRQLLAYKVLRTQLQTAFTAIVFSLFALRGSHFLGVWLAFAALDVYRTFVSFVRARLKLAGIGVAWRLLALAIVVGIIGYFVNRQLHPGAQLVIDVAKHSQNSTAAYIHTISTAFWAPPLGTMMFLPGLFARTMYAAAPLIPALLLAAFGFALFFLTTQLDVSFEDASIVASQRALTRRSRMRAMRSGRSTTAVNRFPPPFRLGDAGRPEVAVFWKNLIASFRVSGFAIVAIVMPLLLAAGAAIFGRTTDGLADGIAMMGLMSTALFVFIGPQALRTDLRTDIVRLDVIKAFPLSAEALVAAELAAPLAVIAVFEFLMLMVSVAILRFAGHYLGVFTMPEFVVSAFVFLVPVIALQLLIQNTAVVLFPAWAMSTDTRGFAVMGQRLLVLMGNVVTLTIALIPAALVFAPGFFLVHKFFGSAPFGILLATIPAIAVLVGEIFLGHKFLASQFEDIDIANDLEAVSE